MYTKRWPKFKQVLVSQKVPPPRTWNCYVIAFDQYCRFDTSVFFWEINRASLYSQKENRIITSAVFVVHRKLAPGTNSCNVHYFEAPRPTVLPQEYSKNSMRISKRVLYHCNTLIPRLCFSISRQVLHFGMCNFVLRNEAN